MFESVYKALTSNTILGVVNCILVVFGLYSLVILFFRINDSKNKNGVTLGGIPNIKQIVISKINKMSDEKFDYLKLEGVPLRYSPETDVKIDWDSLFKKRQTQKGKTNENVEHAEEFIAKISTDKKDAEIKDGYKITYYLEDGATWVQEK